MPSAYIDGLQDAGAARAVEKQVRQRLARKSTAGRDRRGESRGCATSARIDDRRVAEAIARTETSIRRRGRIRVQLQIQKAGIDKSTAKRAIDEVFESIDDGALAEAALNKRLRGRATIEDDKEFQRLYRYLAGQGFEAEQIMKALTARRRRTTTQRGTEDTEDDSDA
jgi:SOS response regulatory protein OraA/RecX